MSNVDSKAQPEPGRRRRWPRRLAVASVVGFIVYTLFGFFGVPLIVRHIIGPRISERLVGGVTIAKASFNPFTLGLVLRDIVVTDESSRTVIHLSCFEGNLDLIPSIFRTGWWFDHARVIQLAVEVELDEHRALNLLSLVGPKPGAERAVTPLQAIPRLVIRDLRVTGASAVIRDLAFEPPVERIVTDLEFVVETLDTDPSYGNPHSLQATLGDAATIAWTGTTYADPLTTEGTLAISDLSLAPFAPYGEQLADVVVERGLLGLDVRYRIAPVRTGTRLTVDAETATVRDLLLTTGGRPLVEVDLLEASGAHGDLDAGELSLDRLRIEGLTADVRRESDGVFEVNRITTVLAGSRPPADEDATSAGGAERTDLDNIDLPIEKLLTSLQYLIEDASSGWEVRLGAIEIVDAALRFEDASNDTPVTFGVYDVDLAAGPIESTDRYRTPFTLTAAGADDAPIHATGVVHPLDPSLKIEIDCTDLVIDPLSPYVPLEMIEPLGGAELETARVSLDGVLEAEVQETQYVSSWDGVVEIAGLTTSRGTDGTPLGFESVELSGRLAGSSPSDRLDLNAAWDGRVVVVGLDVDAIVEESAVQVQLDRLESDGSLDVGATAEALTLGWTGGGSVEQLRARISSPTTAAVHVVTGRLEDARLEWSETTRSLDAARLELSGPMLDAVLPDLATSEEADTTTDDAAGPPVLVCRLAELSIRDGAFTIEDRSTEPPMSVEGSELEIGVQNIDSAGGTPASLQFASRVGDAGMLGVEGQVDPFIDSPFVDATITIKDVSLRPFSPRAEPQLGYTIDRGRVTLDLPIRVENGQLDGQLDARLISFYLGEKVPSESAPNLPLKFGLDLLRDSDDVVHANVGISGDTADPTFTLGGVVWKAILNMISGIATSPFKLFAQLVDVGDDTDLSQVSFMPGTTELSSGAVKNLDALANALGQRAALRLVISGVSGPEDETAMRSAALDAQLAARGAAADVRELFEEQFPDLARPGVPVPPGRLGQGPGPDAMRARLLETIVVSPEALEELAMARARCVLGILVEDGVAERRLRVVTVEEARKARPIEPGPTAVFELLASE